MSVIRMQNQFAANMGRCAIDLPHVFSMPRSEQAGMMSPPKFEVMRTVRSLLLYWANSLSPGIVAVSLAVSNFAIKAQELAATWIRHF